MNTQFSYKVTYLAQDKEIITTIVGAENLKDARRQAANQRRPMVGDRKVISTTVSRIYKAN